MSAAIETLPVLQHDPNRPEDVLKVNADEKGIANSLLSKLAGEVG